MNSMMMELFLPSLVILIYMTPNVLVEAEPPNFTEISRDEEVVEGGTMTLKCRAEGSPKPRIIWLRNDIELTGNRFTNTINGDLTINNVRFPDMGSYICLAKNKISSINATVNLDVRQRTRITTGNGPFNIIVKAGESATFRCSALADPSLDRNLTWLHNGQSIDFSSENLTRGNDGSLIIKHATESETGIYSCVVSTRLDNATADASLSIQRFPYPPELVMLSCDDTTTANISWVDVKPINPHIIAPVDHHIIQYSTSLLPDTWETLDNFNVSQNISQFQARIKMKPRSNYTFRILSVNNFGTSLPSSQSRTCISAQTIHATTFLISWPPISKTDQNGPYLYYNVSYKKGEPDAEWQSRIIPENETGQFTIPDALPFEKYFVKVIAINKQGLAINQTDNSTIFNSYSEYSTPPHIPFKNPDNVIVTAIDPTTLMITWKPMPKTEHNGPGFYYKIAWKMDLTETEWKNINISEWERGEYNLSDTLPYEEYLVKVIVGNDLGESIQPPIIVKAHYEQDVPLEAPRNLQLVKIISSTSAEISWNPVHWSTLRGIFQKYEIEIWAERDQQKRKVLKEPIEYNLHRTIINHMIPNIKNKVRMSVFNEKHQGPFSAELEIDMSEAVSNLVQSLEAKPLGSSALSLFWKPPLKTNGNLTGYEIHYQEVSGTELGVLREHVPQISDPNQTRAKLLDLKPDTKYRISITAITNTGKGKAWYIEQKTSRPGSTLIQPDFQIATIDLENSRRSLVKIIWLPCGTDTENVKNCNYQSTGSEFRVHYRLKGDSNFEEISQRYKDNVIIDNLLPNKDYEFMVCSIDGRLVAKSAIKHFKTDSPEQRLKHM